MSAPLVVNTRDGMCWTRRVVTSSGTALYAPEGVCSCPSFVMATLTELAEHGIVGSADVLPVPVGTGPQPSESAYSPALPWAALMDADDLEGFLADLADAASGDDDLATLDEVESAIARWRLIAEAQHAHNTAAGPDAEPDAITARIAPTQALQPVEDVPLRTRGLRELVAGQREAVDGEHYPHVHRDYRVSHDRPETGGDGRG